MLSYFSDATPVWNDPIYGITHWSIVFAVDARTGKERWRWDPGAVNRGLAIYEGKIFAPCSTAG